MQVLKVSAQVVENSRYIISDVVTLDSRNEDIPYRFESDIDLIKVIPHLILQ